MPNDDGAGADVPGPRSGLRGGPPYAGAGRQHTAEQAVTAQVRTFAGTALAAVYTVGEGDELRLAGSAGPVARYGLPTGYALTGRSAVAEAYQRGWPLWLGSAELAAYRDSAPGALPPGTSLGVLPLGADGRRLGCLVVVDDAADGFGDDRRGFLELYADQVAAHLQASGGPGEQSDGHPEDRPGCPPEEPRSRDPATSSGAQSALDHLDVGSFTLALSTGRIDADERLLNLVGIAPDDFDGQVATLLAHTVPDDVPALMSVVEPGQMASGSRELEFRVRRPTGEQRWLRLRCRVLAGAAGRPERVLAVVADASHLRPRADEVSRVQWLSAVLANTMTVRDVSRAVVAALREPLGADRMALAEIEGDRMVVTVLDPPDSRAWPESWRSEWRGEWPDAPTRVLPTLETVLREGRMSLWAAGTDLEPGLAGVGPGGLAVLPLPAQGREVGVCLVGWDREHAFSPEERSLLTATAGLVGQALMRAQAYDAKHELATMLQRSLLPRSLPTLPGGVAVARYLPAMTGLDVGGDWYDVIPLTDGRAALVIGDVQGHSAGAATIMGQMRTAIRAYAVEGHPPDVVLSHANRLLVGMETDLFATCCYVELDMEEGMAWIVRAGHLQPLLRHPDGTTEEVTAEGGPPLGVLGEADFPLTSVELAPGAVVAMMTDGLVESASLPLEEGIRRVRDVLAVTDPSDAGRVADALLGGPGRRDDDVALLILRYDGMAVRPIRAGWTAWRLPDAVMHARRFTARTLRAWDVTQDADVVLLIVSELVTNALLHTHGAVRLDLTRAGDRLRIAVSDSSPRAPAKPVIVDWEATGGRGILLVEAMSAAWGSVPVSGGKQVWSEIVVPQGEPRDGQPEQRPGSRTE